MPNNTAAQQNSTKRPSDGNPLRTGILGITVIVCAMLTAFGYTKLPFWPQGRFYDAYFVNAAGIRAGNDVQIYGLKVGSVASVALANGAAKVNFSVDRKIRVGDQSLVAIRIDTVLGKRAIEVKPAGSGTGSTIPLSRTTSPYSLNDALQDLGHNAHDIDKASFVKALQTLTDTLHDATPQLHGALDGLTSLSRSLNSRDDQIGELLHHAHAVSGVLAARSAQLNQLIDDGDRLFGELSARRQALSTLIDGIDDVARQISGVINDNRRQFGPTLTKLNSVLDNLNARRDYLDQALKRLPPFSTALGEAVASAPAFVANIYGLPPPSISGILLDTIFQPGKLPASLADFLRGFVSDRLTLKPQTP